MDRFDKLRKSRTDERIKSVLCDQLITILKEHYGWTDEQIDEVRNNIVDPGPMRKSKNDK